MTTSLNRASADATPREALRARGVSVGYRSRRRACPLLEDLNLVVRPGELVCVLGPNGAGKATLLLGRMQPLLAGSVEIGGRDVATLSAGDIARRLGVVLTERVAVEAMSARRIVELGRYPYSSWVGGLDARDHEVVRWAIDAVGIAHLADRDVNRLSDGERQRVMVARALAQEPELLLLDEPTAFLDVSSRVELMVLLRRLTRGGPLAVVLSTHDLELALRSADTIWLVASDGEVMTGAPEDLTISGAVARAFDGRQIRFHPEQRTFRWVEGALGTVHLRGDGLPFAMAAAVLERVGYVVAPDAGASASFVVEIDDAGWRAIGGAEDAAGVSFEELATYLRARARP
jgi:iron complex transport system ATP-binding protein